MAHAAKCFRRLLQLDMLFLKHLTGRPLHKSFYGTSTASWDLVSSVCLERSPIVARDLNDIEKKFLKMQLSIEFERSLKSDHEIHKDNDKKYAELVKNNEQSDVDAEQSSKATAQDFEDACQEELANFQLASRISSNESNLQSLNRKLDKNLLLLVNQKLGQETLWALPQQTRIEGETMRQTADRALKTICGDELKATILGNAPWGFYKYKYPKAIRESGVACGAKIFFFKALYQSGQATGCDFRWATDEEAVSVLPKDYFKSVKKILIREQ